MHDDDQIVYLTIDGEEIETTPWHPFYTDEGWEDAGDLQPGDLILSLDGDYGVVESMVIVDETQTMYDLDVETVDTFAVGDGAWVVHNQDPDPRIIVELFSGPVSQINRSVPGYSSAEALIFTIEIEDYVQLGRNGQFGIQGDATRLPFATGFADEVFLTNMYNEALRDSSKATKHQFRDAVFTDAARILRPGGLLHNSYAGNNKFAKILEPGGAKLIQPLRMAGLVRVPPINVWIHPLKGTPSTAFDALHPALQGARFGRPDNPSMERDFEEAWMKTITCRRS